MLEVVCPDAVSEGDPISVMAPDGRTFSVTCPPGVAPGDAFTIEVPRTVVSVETATAEGRLQPAEAEILQSIQRELGDFDELNDFVNANCGAFLDFEVNLPPSCHVVA